MSTRPMCKPHAYPLKILRALHVVGRRREEMDASKAENTREENMVPQESSRKVSEQAGRVTQEQESP